MGKLPRPSGKELVRFLERQGFILVRVRGSHHFMERADQRTTVPVHGNRKVWWPRCAIATPEGSPARRRSAARKQQSTQLGCLSSCDSGTQSGFPSATSSPSWDRRRVEWRRGENDAFTDYAGFQYDFDFGYDGAYWQFTVEGNSLEPDSSVSGIRYIPGE